jgi:ribosomal protein L11 methyltransferase
LAEYLELDLALICRQESEQEQVLALLADFGFEGFTEEEGRIMAYIEAGSYNPESFDSFLHRHGLGDKIKSVKTAIIPESNWNALWEQNYSPVEIKGKCRVRAPFHTPGADVKYDLLITPKMSFGTAHHETTRLMLESMLERE